MSRGKPPAPLARPKGCTARVKSAVGHLLTIPAFRDILNRRCAWALKVQRPACKARKRPAMSGNWHQQLRHPRRVPFPKLAIVALIIAGAALTSACSQPSDTQQAQQQQQAPDEQARKEADEKAWADAEKAGTAAAYTCLLYTSDAADE